jgi:hypothetical protein
MFDMHGHATDRITMRIGNALLSAEPRPQRQIRTFGLSRRPIHRSAISDEVRDDQASPGWSSPVVIGLDTQAGPVRRRRVQLTRRGARSRTPVGAARLDRPAHDASRAALSQALRRRSRRAMYRSSTRRSAISPSGPNRDRNSTTSTMSVFVPSSTAVKVCSCHHRSKGPLLLIDEPTRSLVLSNRRRHPKRDPEMASTPGHRVPEFHYTACDSRYRTLAGCSHRPSVGIDGQRKIEQATAGAEITVSSRMERTSFSGPLRPTCDEPRRSDHRTVGAMSGHGMRRSVDE